MTAELYRATHPRHQVEARREAVPMTVRQVFYQATVRGSSRRPRAATPRCRPTSRSCAGRASFPMTGSPTTPAGSASRARSTASRTRSRNTAAFYRKALWNDADSYVEIWLEKDALAGVVYPVTSMYDVPLMVARGYASLSFLHSAAEAINELDVPTYIYHLGDFDPSGVNAGEKIEETLRELAPDADITFERIAVTPEQIAEWDLPTRPTKASDTRAKDFGSSFRSSSMRSSPNQLRALVQDAIELHLPAEQFEVLKAAEDSEREIISRLVGEKIASKRPRR